MTNTLIIFLTSLLTLFSARTVHAQRGTDFPPMSRFYAEAINENRPILFFQRGMFVNKTTGLMQIGGPATAYAYLFTKSGKTLQYPNPQNAKDYQVVYAVEKKVRQIGLSLPHSIKVPAGASYNKFTIVNGYLSFNGANTFAACPTNVDWTSDIYHVGTGHKASSKCVPVRLRENICPEIVDIGPAGSGGQLACAYGDP